MGFAETLSGPEFEDRREARWLRPQAYDLGEAAGMANVLDLLMLVLASLGALAFGILAAYGILRVVFALMRTPRRPALVKTQPEIARIS